MTDYKYIEQLLERYWECQTTLEEEVILREFFAQENVPMELLKYRQLFLYQHEEPKGERISDDFESRIMEAISNENVVKAKTISLTERLKPLFRAAAMIAVLITIGTAVEKAVTAPDGSYPEMSVSPRVEQKAQVALGDTTKSKVATTSQLIIND